MGNVQWVASYQGAVSAMPRDQPGRRAGARHESISLLQIDATLSYPLYFTLVDVFGRQVRVAMRACHGCSISASGAVVMLSVL